MNAQVRTTAPARRLGDEWIWVGFRSALRSCSPAEHAGLELERLHVDELARLLLQAAEFQLRGGHRARPRAEGPADRSDARAVEVEARRSALEFEAWRSALDEQLAALHADGASLSPRLAKLVSACLAAAADGGDDAAQAFERADCFARAPAAADSVSAAPKRRGARIAASAGPLGGPAHRSSRRASPCRPEAFSAHAASVAATSAAKVTSTFERALTGAPTTVVPSDAASAAARDLERDAGSDAAPDAAARDAAEHDATVRDAAGRDAAGRDAAVRDAARGDAARDAARDAAARGDAARGDAAVHDAAVHDAAGHDAAGRDATGRDAGSDAGRDAAARDAAGRRSAAESEGWPAARDLAQAARVLAPSARSHCALGRAQLAAGDAAAARGCFRAALASTADVRLQREAQLALDELCRTARLSPAVGAEALGVSHADVPHF